MGAPEVSVFLEWLATDRKVAASTRNQALSALRFLYRDVLRIELGHIDQVPRARTPARVPVVERLTGVPRLVATLLVFPTGCICRDERWGGPSRYHVHESVIQRAVTAAGGRLA